MLSQTNNDTQRISLIVFEFLKYQKACNHSPRTIQFYREKLDKFLGFAKLNNIINIQDITPGLIRDFILDLQMTHTEGGVHTFFRSLRALLNWYEFEHEPENWKNPIRKVKAPRVSEQLLEPVTNEIIDQLLNACSDSTFGFRDKALVLFLQATGARASEILHIDRDDLDINSCSAIVRHGKGGYFRYIFFDRKTRAAIKKYLKTRNDKNKALWLSRYGDRLNYDGLRGIITRLSETAGIESPPLHAFRRGYAVDKLTANVPDLTVVQLMGQHSVNALRPYSKLSKELLQQAYKNSASKK